MVDKTIKTDVSESSIKTEKAVKILPSKKTDLAAKEQEPKKKRISKGLAAHNRKVKQEKRHPSIV
jgi:hypothetical protein